MPAESNHPCFVPPEDKDIKIWRYMDFTKFVSLLETEAVFLSRVDKFEDPYEGATSHANEFIKEKVRTPISFLAITEHVAAIAEFFEMRWVSANSDAFCLASNSIFKCR